MGFFRPSAETRDKVQNSKLKTRYYRASFEDVVKAFDELQKEFDMQLQVKDYKYKELYLCAYSFEVIVTVAIVSVREVGVDMKVNYFSSIGLNRPEKKIEQIYNALNKKMIQK